MCYLGMCALWSLDVGKGGGVLRFFVFLGMWYLGMCALWSLDVGKGGGSLDFVYFWVCGIWVCVLSGL